MNSQPSGMHCGKYVCESSKVCWWYICVQPSISGLQCLLNICGDYAAEHEIIFNCNKTIGVLFCPKKYKQSAPSNVFLNGVRVQFLNQVKYLGVWINGSLKDDDDIQRQVKSLYCAANKLKGTFDQCSPTVKNTLFRAYCKPMYACQLWSKYTQTSMKRFHLHITMPIELCITYPEMLVLPTPG